MTLPINFQEILRRSSGTVNLLAELEWQDRILIAMHDNNRNSDFFESFSGIELRTQQQPNAWKEPIEFPRHAACRCKWRFQDHAANFMVGCQMSSHSGSQRLTEGNNSFWILALRVH